MDDFSMWLKSRNCVEKMSDELFEQKKAEYIIFFGGLRRCIELSIKHKKLKYLKKKQLLNILRSKHDTEEIKTNIDSELIRHCDDTVLCKIYKYLDTKSHHYLILTCMKFAIIGLTKESVPDTCDSIPHIDYQLKQQYKKFYSNYDQNQMFDVLMNVDAEVERIEKALQIIIQSVGHGYQMDEDKLKRNMDVALIPYIINKTFIQNAQDINLIIKAFKAIGTMFSLFKFEEYNQYLQQKDKYNIFQIMMHFIHICINNYDAELVESISECLNHLFDNKDTFGRYRRRFHANPRGFYKTSDERLTALKKIASSFIKKSIKLLQVKINQQLSDMTNCDHLQQIHGYYDILMRLLRSKIYSAVKDLNINALPIDIIKYVNQWLSKNWRNSIQVGDRLYMKHDEELINNDDIKFKSDATDTNFNLNSAKGHTIFIFHVDSEDLNVAIQYKKVDMNEYGYWNEDYDNEEMCATTDVLEISRYDEKLTKPHNQLTANLFLMTAECLLMLNIDVNKNKLMDDIINLVRMYWRRGHLKVIDVPIPISTLMEIDFNIITKLFETQYRRKVVKEALVKILLYTIDNNECKPSFDDIIDCGVALFDRDGTFITDYGYMKDREKTSALISCHLLKYEILKWEQKAASNTDTQQVNYIKSATRNLRTVGIYYWEDKKRSNTLHEMKYFIEYDGLKYIKIVLSKAIAYIQESNEENGYISTAIDSCVQALAYCIRYCDESEIIEQCIDIIFESKFEKSMITNDIMYYLLCVTNGNFIDRLFKNDLFVDVIKDIITHCNDCSREKEFQETDSYGNESFQKAHINGLINASLYGSIHTLSILYSNNFLQLFFLNWNYRETTIIPQSRGGFFSNSKWNHKERNVVKEFWECNLTVFEIYIKYFGFKNVMKYGNEGEIKEMIVEINLSQAKDIVYKYWKIDVSFD